MSGPISSFFQAGHARLDALLKQALADRDCLDAIAYAKFRAGLLKHIALEEKLLLPAIRRLRGGSGCPSNGAFGWIMEQSHCCSSRHRHAN